MKLTNNNQFLKLNIEERHTILIDLEEDKLYLDGKRLITTQVVQRYHPHFLKENNKGHFQKKRVKFISGPKWVFIVECGWDGRIFFLFWDSIKKYERYRQKPDWQGSYWHDRKRGTKKWYGQNLSLPLVEIYSPSLSP